MIRFIERKYEYECSPEKVKQIQQENTLTEPVARLLCRRGIDDPIAAKRFLHPGPEQLFDPFLLPDMEASIDRIKTAVDRHERITVFCDYDADGTCGGCALFLHLLKIGADVLITTPNRHREGYGLSLDAVMSIAADGTKLIITVDCGITNIVETALAISLGLDVIITDHHECGELPDTPYIVDPKRPGSEYPFPYLAGCGIAFKLIHALSSLADAMRYIDLIAVGTITDIVPLLDENRVIAHMGIKKLKTDPCAGLAALADAAGINLLQITSLGVSFGLGPRINAAGRMDTAELALQILSADKPSDALRESADRLCALNARRRKEVEDIEKSAEEMILNNEYMKDSVIMLADMWWNTGVIGIAAAKIAERYTRPCVLFGGNEGSLVGSARSIEGINIFEVLSAFSDRYEKFGGHAQAAGLTINPALLEGLRQDVCAYIRKNYDEGVFEPAKTYDLTLNVGDITREFIGDIAKIEPFGQCNEKPSIAVYDAYIKDPSFFGNEKKPHLKFFMRKDCFSIEAVSFCFKDAHSFASERCDFLCEAEINDYNGSPRLIVKDFAMKYDTKLIESFLAVNKQSMIQSFICEIVDFFKDPAPVTFGEDEFSAGIKNELLSSRFGLCIAAGTVPAFNRLAGIDVVSNALQSGGLELFDEKVYSEDNCIASCVPAGYDKVLRVGVGSGSQNGKTVGMMFDDELLEDYRRYAACFFVPREELLRAFAQFRDEKPITLKEAQRRFGMSPERVAFIFRVFHELKLIETDKSGKIHAIKNGPKKELKQSECFSSFEDLMLRRGLWKN